MLGMQKHPALQRTSLVGVELLFSTPRRSRVAIRDGWREELLPLLAAAVLGK